MTGRPAPAEWSGDESDVPFPVGTPLLLRGCLQAGQRDASSYDRPDTASPKAGHVVVASDGAGPAAACNPMIAIAPLMVDAASVSPSARCRRRACAQLFTQALSAQR